jgi:hypothetical protein
MELIDLNDVKPEDFNYFEAQMDDAFDACLYLIDVYVSENPTAISDPDFEENLFDDIYDVLIVPFEKDIFFNDDSDNELNDIIQYAIDLYFDTEPRSFDDSIIVKNPNVDYVTNQLIYLRGIPQPTQRTPEWYIFRHGLITASNAFKAFENQTIQNQLIYEKCQPLQSPDENKQPSLVNVDTTLHWGQKYEPMSVLIYETLYNTQIEDFGCIPHSTFKFIGASPDGINCDINSPRYGRMLEIKNIVNREINGIPKKEYWIQMQMQMETCDLPECDFLETKFTEYETESAFNEDGSFLKTDNESMKGVIMYFARKDGSPLYIYKPVNMNKIEFDDWENATMELHADLTWIRNCYWKLDKISCVLVPRNKIWFNDNINTLSLIWDTIIHERIHGFSHRKPGQKLKNL